MSRAEALAREDAGLNLDAGRPTRRRNGRSLSSEMADHWFHDTEELHAFLRVLYEGDELRTARDVIDFLAVPDAWTDERDEWILAGEPDAWKTKA